MVTDRNAFAKDVLPRYFKHDNIRSFIRQLNIYGFQRCRHQPGAGGEPSDELEFFHENFVEGRKDLMRQIMRSSNSQKRPGVPMTGGGHAPAPAIADDPVSLMQEILDVGDSIMGIDQQLHIQAASVRHKIRALTSAFSQVAQEQPPPPPQHHQHHHMMQPAPGDYPPTRPPAMPPASGEYMPALHATLGEGIAQPGSTRTMVPDL